MMRKNVKSHPAERVLFETKPQFIVSVKPALIKFVILLIVLYFFNSAVALTTSLQDYLVSMVQIPLVEAVTILLLLIVLVLILWILWDILSWRSRRYLITDKKVIVQSGILRKEKVYMHYDKIQDISVSQSVMERIFRSGDIQIFGGHERTMLLLEDTPNPEKVETMINRLIEGDEIEFEDRKTYKKQPKRRSIAEEYDKKFKR
ncbi:PH domain-containing protein [Methanobacterium paludis]|uniref:Membrane-flanked domain DUF304 n=1 Tax=Methanobacterium paludis (strain DSM 25820 / JCM 18151 / SWAN1) TaxID=868131 RepID=F6D2H6_METPW|nr:PH domain-containing protein [Methanobacterium paludis]AEG17333.1 membrane-flanked domain DUF304 [Methanobacterium paludis]